MSLQARSRRYQPTPLDLSPRAVLMEILSEVTMRVIYQNLVDTYLANPEKQVRLGIYLTNQAAGMPGQKVEHSTSKAEELLRALRAIRSGPSLTEATELAREIDNVGAPGLPALTGPGADPSSDGEDHSGNGRLASRQKSGAHDGAGSKVYR